MADLIGAVTKVTSNFLEINQVSIDNWGFKLFYKCTTVYLILSSVLTTAKQFFGSPIQCDAGSVSNRFYLNTSEWLLNFNAYSSFHASFYFSFDPFSIIESWKKESG